MRTKRKKKTQFSRKKRMWWWLVLLSVCHRLPSSDKGDSTSSHSDCVHWYEDPAHRLVAVPMKTCTTGDRLLLPRPSLWLLSWFTLLLLLRIWSRTSEPAFPVLPHELRTHSSPGTLRVCGTRLWLLRYPASQAKQMLSCCSLGDRWLLWA